MFTKCFEEGRAVADEPSAHGSDSTKGEIKTFLRFAPTTQTIQSCFNLLFEVELGQQLERWQQDMQQLVDQRLQER